MTPENKTLHALSLTAGQHLHKLCCDIPTRQVGSDGNRDAAAYCADLTRQMGYQVTTPQFDCVDWETEGATCRIEGKEFPVLSSPYSNGCQVSACLCAASTLTELQKVQCRDEVLLVYGELAREQLMPKYYPFYNPESHQVIIALLEEKAPAAIIAATSRNPELAGAVYPFPLIEDGNFDIPSVYATEETGFEIARFAGNTVELVSRARRIPSTGSIVLARLNPGAYRKIVVCAHFDAKIGTLGALDNAAGSTPLLLAAELLNDYEGEMGVEFLAMNGEDYYGANGELLYLDLNQSQPGAIALVINMDGLGYVKGRTAFSFYNMLEADRLALESVLQAYDGLMQGEQWYQGDHMVFVMNGTPAVAVTTEHFMEMESEFAHTAKDRPELVSPEKLAAAACAVRDMVLVYANLEAEKLTGR